MAEQATPNALILGDGLTGLSAACVLARSGWQVVIARQSSNKIGRYTHVQSAPDSAMRRLERLIGGQVAGWQSVDALCLDGTADGSDRILRPRTLIAVHSMRNSLFHRAKALGVTWQTADNLTVSRDGRWQLDADTYADLLIQAGSETQAQTPLVDVALLRQELLCHDIWFSWLGRADGESDAFLISARNILGCDVNLARFDDGCCIMSARGSPIPHAPHSLLDDVMMSSDAKWAQRLGGLHFAKRAVAYKAPLARMTQVTNGNNAPALLLLGNALLQTAPHLGRTIAQMVDHISALADFANKQGDWQESANALRRTLEGRAKAEWTAMAKSGPLATTSDPVNA